MLLSDKKALKENIFLEIKKVIQKDDKFRGWIDSSGVKSICCSRRELELFSHTQHGSQPFVISVLGDPVSSSDLLRFLHAYAT